MKDTISFHAILVKAQTMVDGGWRVTLDVPECDASAIVELSKLRERSLGVAIVPEQEPEWEILEDISL